MRITKEEQRKLLTNSKSKRISHGNEAVQGPYCVDSLSTPLNETPTKVKDRINNSLKIAQWNVRGINQRDKIHVVNSISHNFFALQESGHPHSDSLDMLHKSPINLRERNGDIRGGGTLTLSDLRITNKQVHFINKDSSILRIVLDGVFVIWFGNIYLNRGTTKQIQKMFSVIQKVIPANEICNLILVGDFNININEKKGPKFRILNSLCKQLHLTINEPLQGTRGNSKLDFLINGTGIVTKFDSQLEFEFLSDHTIVIWTINFNTTSKPKSITIPNKKLAKEMTELAILDKDVTNALELSNCFLSKRKMKAKQAYLKLTQQKKRNEAYTELLLAVKDESMILKDINLYWENFWNDNERKRYSVLSKEAFKTMNTICKYHPREGTIVNQILLENGTITRDDKDISSTLIQVLKDIQFSEKFHQYDGNLPFPKLPELNQAQIEEILKSLSTGKAVAFDLFSDLVLRDEDTKKKLTILLRDLWSHNLNDIKFIEEIFKARLIALNKVHPDIPKKTDFRPIIILSLIVKILESRWLPKLKEYMICKMCPAQTGFVPGQGVFTNIFRAIERIKQRTDQKLSAFALFIDFKIS